MISVLSVGLALSPLPRSNLWAQGTVTSSSLTFEAEVMFYMVEGPVYSRVWSTVWLVNPPAFGIRRTPT